MHVSWNVCTSVSRPLSLLCEREKVRAGFRSWPCDGRVSQKNPDWQDVCLVANSWSPSAATKAYIKGHLGMSLSEAEQRSVKKAA